MFIGSNNESFDQEHFEESSSLVQNPKSNVFPKADCSSLSSPIMLGEVKSSICNVKLRKATGFDNIPADMLHNEHCINLLFKVIKFAFETGEVPSQWLKGIINPMSKGDEPRCPLHYRPITLLSIPCKIYTNILSRRLCTWVDENEILSEVQNGFRKTRSLKGNDRSPESNVPRSNLISKNTY